MKMVYNLKCIPSDTLVKNKKYSNPRGNVIFKRLFLGTGAPPPDPGCFWIEDSNGNRFALNGMPASQPFQLLIYLVLCVYIIYILINLVLFGLYQNIFFNTTKKKKSCTFFLEYREYVFTTYFVL